MDMLVTPPTIDPTKLTGGTLTGPLIYADTTPPPGSNTFACSQSSIHIVNGANGGRLRTNGADSLIWNSSGLSSPGPLIVSDTTAPAGTSSYICSVSGFICVNGGGGAGRLRASGGNICTWDSGGFSMNSGTLTTLGCAITGAMKFSGSNSSPGAATNAIYNQNTTNNFIYNCGVAHVFNFQNTGKVTIDNSGLTMSSGALILGSGGMTVGTGVITFGSNMSDPGSDNALIRTASGMTLRAADSAIACVGTNGGAQIHACGQSETNKAAAVTIKSPGKNYTNNGTWTNFYNLSEGTHNGEFEIFANNGSGKAIYPITGTTLATVVTNHSGTTFVDSGAAGASNVAFRISGGWLQINVGTSMASNIYFHPEFHGNVR